MARSTAKAAFPPASRHVILKNEVHEWKCKLAGTHSLKDRAVYNEELHDSLLPPDVFGNKIKEDEEI